MTNFSHPGVQYHSSHGAGSWQGRFSVKEEHFSRRYIREYSIGERRGFVNVNGIMESDFLLLDFDEVNELSRRRGESSCSDSWGDALACGVLGRVSRVRLDFVNDRSSGFEICDLKVGRGLLLGRPSCADLPPSGDNNGGEGRSGTISGLHACMSERDLILRISLFRPLEVKPYLIDSGMVGSGGTGGISEVLDLPKRRLLTFFGVIFVLESSSCSSSSSLSKLY